MRDGEDATGPSEHEVLSAFPCGTIEMDGVVTGFWITTSADCIPPLGGEPGALVYVLWRTSDGRVSAARFHVPRDSDDPSRAIVTALPGARQDGGEFGRVLGSFLRRFGPGGSVEEGGSLFHELRHRATWHLSGGRPSAMPGARRAVAKFLFPRIGEAFERFVATIDPEACRLLLANPHMEARLGDAWLALDRTFNPEAPLAEAMRLHPAFADTFTRHAFHGDGILSRLIPEGRLDMLIVSRAQADGIPRRLMPALAEVARLVPAIERELATAPGPGVERVRRTRGSDVHERDWSIAIVRRLAPFPPSWIPKGAAQWMAFIDLCPEIDAIRSWVIERDTLARLMNVGGDWVAFRARLHAAAGLSIPDGSWSTGVEGAIGDARDVCRAFGMQVLMPALRWAGQDDGLDQDARERASGAAHAMLFSGRSLPRILEVSAAWHRRQAGMAAAIAEMPGSMGAADAWGAGLPDARYGDIEMRVLTTEADLVAEGEAGPDRDGVDGLRNCIGGYVGPCMDGRSRIVSIRHRRGDGGWVRLSAAELSLPRGDDGGFMVLEHKGRGNAPAPSRCEDTLGLYLDALRSGSLTVDWEALEPVEPVKGLRGICRFDWSEPAVMDAVLGLWAPLMPGNLRTIGVEALGSTAAGNLHAFPTWSASGVEVTVAREWDALVDFVDVEDMDAVEQDHEVSDPCGVAPSSGP